MGYKYTHAELLDQAEALLHQAQTLRVLPHEPYQPKLEFLRILCAKARILVNRASTADTWFGRQIHTADLLRATNLALALDALAPPPGDAMTIYEAAATLGVGHERVTRYIREGRLLASKFGSQWRLRTVDVLAFQRRPTGRPSTHREAV
jgi:excisionase family DNA binding protein